MKRAFLVFGSFAAVALTLALFFALAAAIVFLASAPQRAGTRPAHHQELISLNYGA